MNGKTTGGYCPTASDMLGSLPRACPTLGRPPNSPSMVCCSVERHSPIFTFQTHETSLGLCEETIRSRSEKGQPHWLLHTCLLLKDRHQQVQISADEHIRKVLGDAPKHPKATNLGRNCWDPEARSTSGPMSARNVELTRAGSKNSHDTRGGGGKHHEIQ